MRGIGPPLQTAIWRRPEELGAHARNRTEFLIVPPDTSVLRSDDIFR